MVHVSGHWSVWGARGRAKGSTIVLSWNALYLKSCISSANGSRIFQSHCQLKSLLRFCLQTPDFVLNDAPLLCADSSVQGNNSGGGAADRSPYSSDYFRVSFDSNDLSTWTQERWRRGSHGRVIDVCCSNRGPTPQELKVIYSCSSGS